MELMVQAGLTPMQVISIATLNAAKALQINDNLGSVQVGKKADFVILNDNPEQNIKNSRTIRSVWKDGKEVSKAAAEN